MQTRLKLKPLILGVSTVIVTTILGMFLWTHKENLAILGVNTAEELSPSQESDLLDEVGKIILLPTDEVPTVATVNDVSKLAEQSFFAHADNGDRVIIYTTAKKAILYRPSEKKIIEVGTADVEQALQDTPESVPAVVSDVSFVFYNGTSVAGLSRRYETEFKSHYPDLAVLDKVAAQKTDYQKSLVIDLLGDKDAMGRAIATELGMEFGSLPEGETAPKVGDFLVIVGADKAPNME